MHPDECEQCAGLQDAYEVPRDAPSRTQVRSPRGLWHSPAHAGARQSTVEGGGDEDHDPQNFNEVQNEREHVCGHGNPAHCTAYLRAPVEAANPQYGVVLVQVVPRVLCRRDPTEDCGWVGSQKSAEKPERAGARAEGERGDLLRVAMSSMNDTP